MALRLEPSSPMPKPQAKAKRKSAPQRSPAARKPASAKSQPAGVGETIGIAAFARQLGVNEDFALAATCAMLTGVAGPEVLLQNPWGPSRLPKLDSLVKVGIAAGRLIECLAVPVERINRRLAQNMGRANSQAIDFLTLGEFESDSPRKHHGPAREATLRRNLEILTSAPTGSLRADLAFDPVVQRAEAIVHSQVLVRKAAWRDLSGLIDHCHFRCALVVEPLLGLDREGDDPAMIARELSQLMDGVLTRGPTGSRGSPSNYSEPARAQVMLVLGQRELDVLPSAGAELLDRMLWCSPDGSDSKGAGKPDGAAVFFDAFQSSLEEIVELRRAGQTLAVRFETPKTCVAFHEAWRVYEKEVAAMPSHPGVSVVGLPATLLAGMIFLRRGLPNARRPSDDLLLRHAFAVARRLAAIHDGQVLAVRRAARIHDGVAIARRVVEKLNSLPDSSPPLKLREIVRCFSCQKKSRFAPVLDALVELDVLLKVEEGFQLGTAELSDVEELLVESLGAAAKISN